jgi:Zn-finger nucleic acid-binding protein
MICPACRVDPAYDEDMVFLEVEGVELDLCLQCRGLWFDAEELEALFARAGSPGGGVALEQKLLALPREKSPEKRRCPRCDRKLVVVRAAAQPQPVPIDLCPREHGLWFDAHELEAVLAATQPSDDPALALVRAQLVNFARPAE